MPGSRNRIPLRMRSKLRIRTLFLDVVTGIEFYVWFEFLKRVVVIIVVSKEVTNWGVLCILYWNRAGVDLEVLHVSDLAFGKLKLTMATATVTQNQTEEAQVPLFLTGHPSFESMATSLTVSSKFTITSHRSDVFGDCGNVRQGRSVKKTVTLSNPLLGSRKVFRHRNLRNSEEKSGPSPCQALWGRKAPKEDPKDEDGADDDSVDEDSTTNTNNVTSSSHQFILLFVIVRRSYIW